LRKIFLYECKRLLWNKFFAGLVLVLLFYGWQVLRRVTILGVSHTAPFSPWSFGDFLSRMLPLLWIGALFIISGKLVGLAGPIPPELLGWLACGAVGGVSVCAVQLYFSLVIRAFAPPVAFGLIGGIAGLMVTAQGFGYAFPYSLPLVRVRGNNPD